MHRPDLLTQRIELRPMAPAHLPLLVELDSDPEVLRHLLGRARTREEVHEFWGPVCADEQADAVGLGWWVGFARPRRAASLQPGRTDLDDSHIAELVDASAFLGWWDLSPALPHPTPDRPPDRAELGYRLARRHWRNGLATEGARALLAHGFGTVALEAVWAETKAVNAGSRGVMRRLGLRHLRTEMGEWADQLDGAELGEVVYEISRDEWLRHGGR